jgi:SpoVK/Ycf46/Vps4 family AAA+-type ATPase
MPFRLDRELEIPPPDPRQREQILRVITRRMPLHPSVSLASIASLCLGYVGADLASLAREATLHAWKRNGGKEYAFLKVLVKRYILSDVQRISSGGGRLPIRHEEHHCFCDERHRDRYASINRSID